LIRFTQLSEFSAKEASYQVPIKKDGPFIGCSFTVSQSQWQTNPLRVPQRDPMEGNALTFLLHILQGPKSRSSFPSGFPRRAPKDRKSPASEPSYFISL
jgi:hypothetical protein